MAIDGHFWVDAQVNGKTVKFLVDSGATVTTIDRDTALEAGVASVGATATNMSAPAMASSRVERPRRGARGRGHRAAATSALQSPTMTI